jgi:hypothetical protein
MDESKSEIDENEGGDCFGDEPSIAFPIVAKYN